MCVCVCVCARATLGLLTSTEAEADLGHARGVTAQEIFVLLAHGTLVGGLPRLCVVNLPVNLSCNVDFGHALLFACVPDAHT